MTHPVRFLVAALGIAAKTAAAGLWETTQVLPRGLAGHAFVASANGTLSVAGGSYWEAEKRRIDSTVRQLRPGDDMWRTVATLPCSFAHGGVALVDNTLWLAGGFDDSGPVASIQRTNLATFATKSVATLPEPRGYCAAAKLDGALWVVGGTVKDGAFAELPAICFRIDLTVSAVRPLPGPAMVNPVVLVLGGELHVLPGSVWSVRNGRLEAPTEVWMFSAVTERWRQRTLAHPLPRGLTGVALDEYRAVLVGGVETQAGANALGQGVWVYDARDGSLRRGPKLPEPRLASAIVNDGKSVWLAGGEDRPRSRAVTVWRMDISDLSRR